MDGIPPQMMSRPATQSMSSGGGTRGSHPLQTNWKFWYVQRQFPQAHAPTTDGSGGQHHYASKKKFDNYRDRLKDMGSISTVEGFFQYFVYMKKPNEMPREIDLFFFREGEIPMWEV